MPVTFVAQTLLRNHAGSSAVIDKPAGVVAGDLLLALVYSFTDATVTPPAGWTLLTTQSFTTLGAGPEAYNHVYYKVAGGSEPATYTFSGTLSGLPFVRMSAWRGCSQTNSIESFNTTSEDAPADDDLAWSSLTSTVDGSMLVCLASGDATFVWNTQAGWTVFDDDELLAYKALPAAGATGSQTHSHSGTADNGKVGVMLTLAPVGAGFRHYCESVNLDLA